jgi:hypothetical protein
VTTADWLFENDPDDRRRLQRRTRVASWLLRSRLIAAAAWSWRYLRWAVVVYLVGVLSLVTGMAGGYSYATGDELPIDTDALANLVLPRWGLALVLVLIVAREARRWAAEWFGFDVPA